MDYSEDLAFMLSDAPGSVRITCGGSTADGILDTESEVYNRDDGKLEVQGLSITLVFDQATLPALKKGVSLTTAPQANPAQTTAYKVRDTALQLDGTTLAWLVKP